MRQQTKQGKIKTRNYPQGALFVCDLQLVFRICDCYGFADLVHAVPVILFVPRDCCEAALDAAVRSQRPSINATVS